jgi:phage terminase large subunit-like protein
MPNILAYCPWGAQVQFHASTKFGRILTAGNRKGKTDAMVVEFIKCASNTDGKRPELWGNGPVQLRIITVDIVKGVNQIMIPKFKRWMTPSMLIEGSWDKSWDTGSMVLTFANGSKIDFLTYGMSLEKHAGVPRHMIGFDEEPPRDIFNESMMRLMDYDGKWVIAATPINGMEWIFDLLVEPALAGDLPDVEVFELVGDNPYLQAEDKSKFMLGMDKEEREIRGEGKFVARSGLVFPKIKDNLSKFVLDEVPDVLGMVAAGWQIYTTMDHGWNNPTAWLWLAVSREGECVVFSEHYASEVTVPEHATIVLTREQGWLIPEEDIIRSGDPHIDQTSGITGTSVLAAYAENGVYIGTSTIPRGTGSVMIGIEKLQQYFRLGLDGYPKLRISPNCLHLIRELKKLRWATYDSAKTAYTKNKREEINEKDDHAFDALRYWATQMPDLTPEIDGMVSRDRQAPVTIGFAELIARMEENGEVEFVSNETDPKFNPEWLPWETTEASGNYYEEESR